MMRFRQLVSSPLHVVLGCSLLVLPTIAVLSAPTLSAQEKGVVQRTVEGKVTNDAGKPVKGAIVYLKDPRTQSVKSYITSENGDYRFVQLSSSTDYELHAELSGKKSKNKTISSFDDKNDFTIDLKVD
jgi:hypothetical protein